MAIRTRKLTTPELVGHKPAPNELARAPRHPISVVCDEIRGLPNVGLIFRLCDAIRADRLYLCGITGYPPSPDDPRPRWVAERAGREIAKTAIQTIPFVPWVHRPNAAEVVRELKEKGTQIVAIEQTAVSLDYTRATYQFPVCLVVGHEREGVADPVLEVADLIVHVPMHGMGNSLNVALALGVCAYEVLRHYELRTLGSAGASAYHSGA